MKALWLVSFRPIGKSKINDFYQSMFVDSVKSLDFDITFSLTQFEEPNVNTFIEQKKIKNYFTNIPKKNLPTGKKYSNKLMLDNALDQYIEGDFDYLIYSTADIIVPNKIFSVLSKKKENNFCSFIYPNIYIKNVIFENNFLPHFCIELICFKIY